MEYTLAGFLDYAWVDSVLSIQGVSKKMIPYELRLFGPYRAPLKPTLGFTIVYLEL